MKVVDKIKSKAGKVKEKAEDFYYENEETIAFVAGFGLTTLAIIEGIVIGKGIGYNQGKKDAYEQVLKNNVTGFVTKNLDEITK